MDQVKGRTSRNLVKDHFIVVRFAEQLSIKNCKLDFNGFHEHYWRDNGSCKKRQVRGAVLPFWPAAGSTNAHLPVRECFQQRRRWKASRCSRSRPGIVWQENRWFLQKTIYKCQCSTMFIRVWEGRCNYNLTIDCISLTVHQGPLIENVAILCHWVQMMWKGYAVRLYPTGSLQVPRNFGQCPSPSRAPNHGRKGSTPARRS